MVVYKLYHYPTFEQLRPDSDQRDSLFSVSKVFVEDLGKDLDKDVLGSFPRSFRIFSLRIKGSFAYVAKIFIDLSRFSDRSQLK